MNKQNLEFLGRLIAARSVSSKDPAINMSNRKAAAEVAQMVEEHGFTVTEQEVPGLEDKVNIAAHAGPDAPGTGLVLAGHVDTVPCEAKKWDSDPFEMIERDGIIYGLGVCDMKGFFGIIAEALNGIDLGGLKKPLQIWATADEECGMDGAAALVKFAPPGEIALLGEPTDLTPVYGHKGAMAEEIVLHGRSGHSSNPAAGANAIEAMQLVIAALQQAHQKAIDQHSHPDFTPAEPTLGFNRIEGGDSHNRIADHCKIWLDRRISPSEDPLQVRAEIHETAKAAITGQDGISIEFNSLAGGLAAARTEPDRPIIQFAEELSGRKAKTEPYATEATHYTAAGMDVLIMGAGNIKVAHQPNECVALADQDVMAGYVRALINHFCFK